VLLGLMGEYLGRLFLTENQTPQFVVREVVEMQPHASVDASVPVAITAPANAPQGSAND
jgi:hypothetical protein